MDFWMTFIQIVVEIVFYAMIVYKLELFYFI